MTGVQADVAEANEKALDMICNASIEPEQVLGILKELRDHVNSLSWELAKATRYDDEPEKWMKRALMAKERQTVLCELDDWVAAYDGALWIEELHEPGNELTGAYERIELFIDGFELP